MKKIYLMLLALFATSWSYAQTCTNTISTFPHLQNFESATTGSPGTLPTGWTINPTTGLRWQVQSGPTSSLDTGPDVDHTVGTSAGKYVYLETSSGTAGATADLISPCFDITGMANPSVEFWYHMYGATTGSMRLEVRSGTTWTVVKTLTGEQQTSGSAPWLKETVSLAAYSGVIQFRFVGVRGSSFTGDVAVDDFRVFSTFANDVGVTAITSPVTGCGLTAATDVCITVTNHGGQPQSNFPVTYQIGTNPVVTETFTGTLAGGASAQYCFNTKANLATPGNYTMSAATALVGDQSTANNAFTGYTFTSIQSVSTFPYFENFENTTHGWTTGGTNSSWALGTPANPVINSAASGSNSWITNLTGTYSASENSFVKSPCFNMSALGAPIIELKVWWNSEASWDGAALQSSIDGGTTWQTVGAVGDPVNWYNDASLDNRVGGQSSGWAGRNSTGNGSGGWLLAQHDLTGLGGQSSVIFRIAFGSDGSVHDDGFAFDDVKIYDRPANDVSLLRIVQPVSGCGLSNCEMVAVEIKNEGSQPQSNIPVFYQINNGTPIQGTYAGPLAPGDEDFFIFPTCANLSARSIYTFKAWVAIPNEQPFDRMNDTVGGYEVSNLQVRPTNTTPYFEDFEQNRGGWEAIGPNSTWAYGTPAKQVISGAASGQNAWVTGGLGTGTHNVSEASFVRSPCMDFTAITTPILEMKVWWHSEYNKDGAAIQSSIDGGNTWQVVGTVGPDWYNSSTIASNPGGQQTGWSGSGTPGTTGGGSGGWVSVRQELTGLGGRPSVRLRVVFGSDAANNFDGFAFDDIMIYKRPDNDLAIRSIEPITAACGLGTCEKVRVVVANNGFNQVPGFDLSYTVNGGTPVTQTFTLPAGNLLNPGQSRTFEFTTCANLANPGSYTIEATVTYAPDELSINNRSSLNVFNSLYTTLPVGITFESGPSSLGQLSVNKKSESNVSVSAVAGNNSSYGMLMEGGAPTPWTDPIGFNTPWNSNPEHLAVATLCLRPSEPLDSLIMHFELKQIYKTLFANTAFRITVNGAQVGPTYHPPVTGPTTAYDTFRVDLTPYLAPTVAQQQVIRIGFESNVRETYSGGSGTANFVDNIFIRGYRGGVMTGVKDQFAKGISVYPNPSADVFKVEVENAKNYTIEVMDLSGRLIKKLNGKGTETARLDMSNQAKGIYLMRIISQEGHVTTRKLVLQ